MIGLLPVSALICVVAGFAMRAYLQRFEMLHLRWAWDFLRESPAALSDERRETVLDRTHKAISTARLGRLGSLMLLIPGLVCVVIASQAIFPLLPWLPPFVWVMLLGAVLPFLALTLTQAILSSGFYAPGRASSVENAPSWLTDDSEAVPGLIEAGSSLWNGLVSIGERFSRRFGLERPQAWLVEQDDHLVLAVGEKEFGAIDPAADEAPRRFGDRTERDMIRAIQRLDETLVREVMRPLNSVTAISLINLTSEKFLTTARRTGFTRFPCYYDQITNLIGYLNVHDFLDSPVLPPDPRRLVHEALFIPEIGRLDLVLAEMQKARQQIAICFDEYGGCSGLLSREDIIEEITGEIMDEYDRPEFKIQEIRGEYLVDGTVDLDDLREMLGLDLSREVFVTLAGYIYHRFSRMPKRGEAVEEHDWRIEVAQVEGHRVRKVRLVPPADYERPSLDPNTNETPSP